jgi:glycerol-3-phosphate acyltransferase PlsX
VCIICHGGSNANAIKNAIRVAAEFAEGQVNEKIEGHLAATAIGNLESARGVGTQEG